MAKPRTSTLLLVIGFVTSAAAAGIFFVGLNAEKTKRVWAEGEIQKLTAAKQSLEQELDEISKSKLALEEQVADLGNQAKTVAEQLAAEKRAREALTQEVAKVQKDSSDLKGQLAAQQEDNQALTEDLARAKQSYQAVSNELTTLRQAKEALEKRVKEMLAARAKEAEQIVVRPGVTSPAAANLIRPTAGNSPALTSAGKEAKVLVVNREFDFVVLNVGSRDAVRKGSRFQVVRSDKPIMTLEVEKVYENMSAANMLDEEKKGSELKEGDQVRPSA